MSEENEKQESGAEPSAETLNTEARIPRERLNQVLSEKKALEDRLARLEAEQREKEASALAEQGKYKELYEQALQEVEPLRAAKAELEQRKQELDTRNKERLALIPEDKRALIPEIDDPVKLERWLDRSLSLIVEQQRPQAPASDGGAKSTTKANPLKLSDMELEFAKLAGISPERYAEQKSRRGSAIDIDKLKKE